MNGESSLPGLARLLGDGGRESEADEGASEASIDLSLLLPLRLMLNKRLWPDEGGDAGEDLPLRLLPSLSTVFSTAFESRLTLLGDRPGLELARSALDSERLPDAVSSRAAGIEGGDLDMVYMPAYDIQG